MPPRWSALPGSYPSPAPPRTRRFDPVGQTLVVLVLAGVVYAIIESRWFGWTSPAILGLLAAAALALLGILGYEPRRADPLLELRLFRSTPFSAAILISLFGLCGFGAFLFVTTQYLQTVRGMSPRPGRRSRPLADPALTLRPVHPTH